MNRWFRVPDGLGLVQAAALPMTVDTAFWHLSALGFDPEKSFQVEDEVIEAGTRVVEVTPSARLASRIIWST